MNEGTETGWSLASYSLSLFLLPNVFSSVVCCTPSFRTLNQVVFSFSNGLDANGFLAEE
jgi:hypothetical protein